MLVGNYQWLTPASSTISTFPITAGVNKVKMPFAAGTPQATLLSSSGATLVDFAPQGMVITDTPTTYNYNYYMFASP
jgi:glucan endo-1,3-alpha-glucosidase